MISNSFFSFFTELNDQDSELIRGGSSQLINQVLELTNAERAEAGLNPLTLNPQLSQAAEGHSDNMANDYFFNSFRLTII